MNRQTEIRHSYASCRRYARRNGSSFHLAFWLLPRDKREAMWALYAFLRRCDDLADEPGETATRAQALAQWSDHLQAAKTGEYRDPLFPALCDCQRRFDIPWSLLDEAIAGARMDLDPVAYQTFDDLRRYCHHVAGVVGQACARIWGANSSKADELADQCGLAFQLTNILRDVREDALIDRVYLPANELALHAVTPAMLKELEWRPGLEALYHMQIERARRLYDESRPLEGFLSQDSRAIFRALVATYRRLLERIAQNPRSAFRQRVRLGLWSRVSIVSGSLFEVYS